MVSCFSLVRRCTDRDCDDAGVVTIMSVREHTWRSATCATRSPTPMYATIAADDWQETILATHAITPICEEESRNE